MWRTRAVRRMLIEEVAGLRYEDPGPGDRSESERREDHRLRRARRRAMGVVVLDWAAILLLVLLRNSDGALLFFGPSEDTVFTLGVLAVAAHSGFRLGQWEKYRSVTSLVEELAARSDQKGA